MQKCLEGLEFQDMCLFNHASLAREAWRLICRGRYSSRCKIQRVIRLRTKLTDLSETLEP
jgi:hypothetical protein